jgi:hypothetical protein
MTSDDSKHKPAFADMDLRVGQKMLLMVDWPTPEKYYSQLIGYQEPEFLIFKPPEANGGTVQLALGKNVEVRLFSGVSVFSFKTRVQAFLMHPRNYMLMSFPDIIEESRLRAHSRVACDLPATMTGIQGSSQPENVQIKDLSGGGALVVAAHPLAPVGTTLFLCLEFALQATGQMERMELAVTVRNVLEHKEATGSTHFRHGLEFTHPNPKVFLLVHELQQQKNRVL